MENIEEPVNKIVTNDTKKNLQNQLQFILIVSHIDTH